MRPLLFNRGTSRFSTSWCSVRDSGFSNTQSRSTSEEKARPRRWLPVGSTLSRPPYASCAAALTSAAISSTATRGTFSAHAYRRWARVASGSSSDAASRWTSARLLIPRSQSFSAAFSPMPRSFCSSINAIDRGLSRIPWARPQSRRPQLPQLVDRRLSHAVLPLERREHRPRQRLARRVHRATYLHVVLAAAEGLVRAAGVARAVRFAHQLEVGHQDRLHCRLSRRRPLAQRRARPAVALVVARPAAAVLLAALLGAWRLRRRRRRAPPAATVVEHVRVAVLLVCGGGGGAVEQVLQLHCSGAAEEHAAAPPKSPKPPLSRRAAPPRRRRGGGAGAERAFGAAAAGAGFGGGAGGGGAGGGAAGGVSGWHRWSPSTFFCCL